MGEGLTSGRAQDVYLNLICVSGCLPASLAMLITPACVYIRVDLEGLFNQYY